MFVISSAIQLLIAFGLINVWIIRFAKPTKYRGRGAHNMREEFKAYGLPLWSMYLVGTIKLSIALLLIIGFWAPAVITPSLYILTFLMLGAITMHYKVKDPVVRMLPAISMFGISLVGIYTSNLI